MLVFNNQINAYYTCNVINKFLFLTYITVLLKNFVSKTCDLSNLSCVPLDTDAKTIYTKQSNFT